jgi:small-conductance mechanosensitive channel
MTVRQKLYAAGAVAALILTIAAVDAIRLRVATKRYEREAAALAAKAEASERTAAAAKESSVREAARAEFLEQQLKEVRDIAARQDEQIKKMDALTDDSRGRVARARGVRTVQTTIAELCAKLAGLGHPCE